LGFGHAPYTFLPQVVCGVFTLLARSLYLWRSWRCFSQGVWTSVVGIQLPRCSLRN